MPSDFNTQYRQLNKEQQEAINHIEGPLLVIAGPGTGKTQLLSIRAANILKKTDVSAENILCLTFTESGAQEMRQRLIRTIGEAAYKITISTYHGFGNEIINRNPGYFEGGTNLRPISKLKIDTVLRDIQKDLPFTSELKNPQAVSAIAGRISDAKQALLNPADLIKVAEANLEFIERMSNITKPISDSLSRVSLKALDSFTRLLTPNNRIKMSANVESLESLWNTQLEAAIDETKDTKKARALTLWKAKFLSKDDKNLQIAKGTSQNDKLKDFAKIYQKYIDRLKKDSLYDYDDMIQLSIEALKKYPELRFNLQEKYLYIMLDEYQDTNLAQAELTYLLTDNPVLEGQPNIMALGDDDQAIFAFQGAKHSNMLDFTLRYRDVKQITLKSNYRSTQSIINLSSLVAEQVNERLTSILKGVTKDFKAIRPGPGEITSLNFNSEIEQYDWLAKNIKPKSIEDIAIIAPEHKYLERASAYLADQGIAISYDRRENVLEDLLIDRIITILRLLKAINDKHNQLIDSLAATVLNYDFWQLPTEAIWKISWEAHDNKESWLKVMLDTKSTKTIALMLIKLAANAQSYRYDFIIDQVIGLSDIVINDHGQKSTRSSFLNYYSESNDDLTSYRLYQNLMVIKEQFKDFNQDNLKPLMIDDLIDFIDQLKSSNIKLTNDFDYGPTNAKVKLMTAHGSKGQEFESVYLLSFVNEAWGPKAYNRNQISLPANLEFMRRKAEDLDDERLRLLYVALTRAKNKIVSLSYDQDTSGKTTTPLKYLSLNPKQISTTPNLTPLWQSGEGLVSIPTDLKELLLKRLENYTLNPTDLNKFIDVRHAGPKNFYDSVLLKYKAPVPSKVDYGSAIHNSLQWLQQTLISTNKVPPLNQLIDEFEKLLLKRRLPPEDFKNLKNQGQSALKSYYRHNKNNFSKNDKSEYDFRGDGIVFGSVRLSGQIDKLVIDKSKKTISIVDYKTGKGQSNWDSQPKHHIYQNQLYFYKLLVDRSPTFKGYRVTNGLIDFIEPDISANNPHKLSLEFKDEELERLGMLIEAVWKHVKELDFPSIANYQPNLKGIRLFEEDLIAGRI